MPSKFLIISGIIAAAVIGILLYLNAAEPVFLRSRGTIISIDDDPIQLPDSTSLPKMVLSRSHFIFAVQAHYQIRGMLVSKKKYYRGNMRLLSPYDYALIWGRAPEYLPYLKFSQVFRYAIFQYKLSAPVDKDYIQKHMSNNHLIPANLNLRRAMKKGRKGDLIEIEGYLVNVKANLKRHGANVWNTSLNRTDAGDGACEIIYVTKLRINDRIYE